MPRSLYRQLWQLLEKKRIAAARLRTYGYRLLGCQIGPKCLFGSGVKIDRPWTVKMGQRCMLEPNVWFDIVSDEAFVTVGEHVFMGRNVHLLISDGLTIGNHCLIGDGVAIADHKHNTAPGLRIGEQGCNSAKVTIGNDVMICVRAMILQGVTIGDGAIIGPGAIVSQNVQPNAIVGVAPGRVLGNRMLS